jgi:S-adenosylmethionine decarboxylase
VSTGIEWVIDARGCDAARLRDEVAIRSLLDGVIAGLELHVVGSPRFHVFPGEAGITALYLLSESHLTCHTYPESGTAAFNLYCCRARPEWPWREALRERLGATSVTVRALDRGGAP